MRSVLNWLRYKLMLVSALVVVPLCYLHRSLRAKRVEPNGYFLDKLARTRNGFLAAIYLFTVLSMARRSYSANWANLARRCVVRPIPVWGMDPRHSRLLIEAAIWHGGQEEFESLAQELLHSADAPAGLDKVIAEYASVARADPGATDAIRDRLVLPALHWERRSTWLEAAGFAEQAAAAMHEALCFVPDGDVRRSELVARLLQLNAMSAARG